MKRKMTNGCPSCGGDLIKKGIRYSCEYCSQEFDEEKANSEMKKVMAYVDKDDLWIFAIGRRNLYDHTHKEHISTTTVRRCALSVKREYPDDFLADFYMSALSYDRTRVNSFMDSMNIEENRCHVKTVIEFMLRIMDSINVESMKNLVERAFDGEERARLELLIESKAKKLGEGLCNVDKPRDTNTACPSKGADTASKEVKDSPINPTTAKQYKKFGDIIVFGRYPQTRVDATAENGLSSISFDKSKWNSYGYYENGSEKSYMYYLDVDTDGDGRFNYRGVYFDSYRPCFATLPSNETNSYQYENGYSSGGIYWFRYNPIIWEVLESKDGRAMILAHLILDSQDYNHTGKSRKVNQKRIYANNYAESHIRKWLNDTFYDTAFSEMEKTIIPTTTVDNSASTTRTINNKHACDDTRDHLFLLSYEQATKHIDDIPKFSSRARITDYAQCQGAQANSQSGDGRYASGDWWLRSPYCNYAWYFDDGYLHSCGIDCTGVGIRPACWIDL